MLLLMYGLGIGSGVLVLYAYGVLDRIGLRQDAYVLAQTNMPGLLLYAILVIGLVEEIAKFLPFWLVALRLRSFDEPVDGIIYGSFVALGFATHENIQYLGLLEGPAILARAAAAPLVHILFASIWGYTCGHARAHGRPLLPAALGGLALSATIHGVYDFFEIGLSAWVRSVPAVLVLAIWLWRIQLVRRLTGEGNRGR